MDSLGKLLLALLLFGSGYAVCELQHKMAELTAAVEGRGADKQQGNNKVRADRTVRQVEQDGTAARSRVRELVPEVSSCPGYIDVESDELLHDLAKASVSEPGTPARGGGKAGLSGSSAKDLSRR